MMANGNPSNIVNVKKLSPNDRQMAIALRALLDKSLVTEDHDETTPTEAEASEEVQASKGEAEASDVEMLL